MYLGFTHKAKETGFLSRLRAVTKYFRKNPVSDYPCVLELFGTSQQISNHVAFAFNLNSAALLKSVLIL